MAMGSHTTDQAVREPWAAVELTPSEEPADKHAPKQ